MAVTRILISQPTPSVDKKSPFSCLLDRFSVSVDFRPFISVEGATLKEFISQRVTIVDHTAVIFTSRLLIDNFFRLVGETRVTIPDTMKYFCISEAIALYLQKYIVYRKRKIFVALGTVNSLMEMVLKHNTERYFVPLSEPHKPEIPMAMERASLSHTLVILSHTCCNDLSDIDASIYDIVALYSPSEVKNFKKAFVEGGYKGRLAAFGEATTRAALAEGIAVDMMAPTPEYPSMVSVISAYCKAEHSGGDLSVFAVENVNDDAQSELMKMAEKRKRRVRKEALSTTTVSRMRTSTMRGSSRSVSPRAISSITTKTIVKSSVVKKKS